MWLRLAWRWLKRERRQGELTLIFTATLLAAAVAALTGRFTAHINQNLLAQGADLLGADLIIDSPAPVPDAWVAEARSRGLEANRSVEFASVVVHDEQLQLSSVKAAQSNYPLRGTIRIADTPHGRMRPAAGMPNAGTVWIEPRLFDLLGLEIGDVVRIGDADFTLGAALMFEPSRGGSFFNLSPRILMRWSDLDATGLIQPGSRVKYRIGFAGPKAGLESFSAWLRPRLRENHELVDVHSGRPAMSQAISRIEQYLYLGSASALLLSGIAIAVTARRYARRHLTSSALLRTYGIDSRRILGIFLTQITLLGLLASLGGALLGWLGGQGLLHIVNPAQVPPRLEVLDASPLIAVATGLVILLGFGIAPLLAVKRAPPVQVLRRLENPPALSPWISYLLAGSALFLLMLVQTRSLELVLRFSLGVMLVILVAAALILALVAILKTAALRVRRLWWRYGILNLWRYRRHAGGQAVAFGLIFMCFALLFSVRQELYHQWQEQLPEKTPNHFAINIQPQQADAFAEKLRELDIDYDSIYPMVRGRLIEINGQPVRQAVSKEAEDHNALRRELNLTWAQDIPYGNELVKGSWWDADTPATAISVESQLAQQLDIRLGDRLTFLIGSDTIAARVANLRSVEWESFRPNFYVIFPPGRLSEFPATFMTSFYLADERRGALPRLLEAFPSVTFLDVEYLLEQVRRMFDQGSRAVTAVLALILFAGTILLFATVLASTDERTRQAALLRALGASGRQLRQTQFAEFTTLGLLSGLLAWIGTELARYGLLRHVFALDYAPNGILLLTLVLSGMLGLGAIGIAATAGILKQPPSVLLRESP